jgi:hypothetical protein
VVAVVDTVHSANLGGGSNLGLALLGGPFARQLEGISAAKGKKADVKIHNSSVAYPVPRPPTSVPAARDVHASGEAVFVESARTASANELVLRAFRGPGGGRGYGYGGRAPYGSGA